MTTYPKIENIQRTEANCQECRPYFFGLKEPGAGFAVDTNIVTIIDKKGAVEELPKMTKEDVAWIVLDMVAASK